MALPRAWSDHLLARLSVRYGRAFMAQYPDMAPAAVSADWGEVLDGLDARPDAIAYALNNLPDRALNALEFRQIARRAPALPVKALPEPLADPARVAEAMDQSRALARTHQARQTPAQATLTGIVERALARGRLSPGQLHFAGICIRKLGQGDPLRDRLAALGVAGGHE